MGRLGVGCEGCGVRSIGFVCGASGLRFGFGDWGLGFVTILVLLLRFEVGIGG